MNGQLLQHVSFSYFFFNRTSNVLKKLCSFFSGDAHTSILCPLQIPLISLFHAHNPPTCPGLLPKDTFYSCVWLGLFSFPKMCLWDFPSLVIILFPVECHSPVTRTHQLLNGEHDTKGKVFPSQLPAQGSGFNFLTIPTPVFLQETDDRVLSGPLV